MSTAIATGKITDVEIGPSIADGITGNLEAGSVTPAIIAAGPVDTTSVTDAQIHTALRRLFTDHGLVAEGAGACGLAAVLAGKVEITGRLVIILSGRNLTPGTYTEAIAATAALPGSEFDRNREPSHTYNECSPHCIE